MPRFRAERRDCPAELSPEATIITPPSGWHILDVGALWQHRELLLKLAWRDVKVRYKQTIVGAAWAIIQPFVTMVVFSVFFGRFANMPSEGVPYPIFSYAGLLPWTFFSEAMKRASDSLVGNASLVSKVYFPRVVLPMASVLSRLVDFAVAFTVLLAMMAYFHVPITWRILWVPVFIALAFLGALGTGLWLSAINVRFRDIKYALPFIIQLWMFATPVIYPVTLLPERWQILLSLNPMTGVVNGCRWAILGTGAPPTGMFWVSVGVTVLVLVTGLLVFHKMERTFADVV